RKVLGPFVDSANPSQVRCRRAAIRAHSLRNRNPKSADRASIGVWIPRTETVIHMVFSTATPLLSGDHWMKSRYKACSAVAITFFLLSGTVSAHHGNSEYDTEHNVTVKGNIAEFEFINPHARIRLMAKNDQGAVEEWNIEMGSPNSLRR